MLNRREFLATSAGAFLTTALSQKADAARGDEEGEWRNKQSGMSYRRLGRTGYMVSEIVMGGNELDLANLDHVLLAMDHGLNYIDTASGYGNGRSERAVAGLVKARGRDNFFLNTKVSTWHGNRHKLFLKIFESLPESEQKKLTMKVEEQMEATGVLKYDYIGMYNAVQPEQTRTAALCNLLAEKYSDKIDRRKDYYQLVLDSLDESLERMGTDHVDVVTCPHGASTPYEVSRYEEIFEAFEKLKQQGKARHLSVSSHNDPGGVLRAAVDTGVYSMAMVAYNVINHKWVDGALEHAKKSDFGVISMKSARAVHDTRKGKTVDPRRVEYINKMVPGPLKTAQKAYLWNLRNPNLSAAVANMSDRQQVEDDMALAAEKG
jgi:predicted aldo/keto reductase-like oxidoreductase